MDTLVPCGRHRKSVRVVTSLWVLLDRGWPLPSIC